MNIRLIVSILCLILACSPLLRAQFGTPEEMAAQARIESVQEKVREKAAKGQLTAEALAPELKELDGYIEEFADHKNQIASFIYTKALIYADALNDFKRARELLKSIKRDLPNNDWAGEADRMLAFLEKAERRNVVNAELTPVLQEIERKARSGLKGSEHFISDLKKLEGLLTKYAKNPEAAGHVAFYKAVVFLQVINAYEGRELLKAVATKYPDTLAAEMAQQALDNLPAAAESK